MKIALIGYGKMGHEIERIALSRGHEIVCRIDIDNLQDFDSPEFKSAQVAIEFTAPSQAYSNIRKAFAAGVKTVSGSTGWMAEHCQEMKDLCKDGQNTLLWSSNFSIGVALFAKVNSFLAGLMNSYPMYEVSMSETHHIHKLDAPSGTAITLAEGIISQLDRKNGWKPGTLTAPDGNVSGSKECSSDNIRIDSIREDEVPGIHSITYDSDADFITITHSAKNRSGLALGAVLAAEFVQTRNGFLTMDDLMDSLS
ncbi:MAG: 4-hydroxy-tetrahydrodipicolinate reductase [Bacteroidaceae bacterium]|nr:4-hydroxy-tetrahydrodipicolinate reductase [Bacteroidaceae bacterium]